MYSHDPKVRLEELRDELPRPPSGYDVTLPERFTSLDPSALTFDQVRDFWTWCAENDATFHPDDWSDVPIFSSNNGETSLFSPEDANWVMSALDFMHGQDAEFWGKYDNVHGLVMACDGLWSPGMPFRSEAHDYLETFSKHELIDKLLDLVYGSGTLLEKLCEEIKAACDPDA